MMMNENNEVFTMEDEPLASVVQNMRKGSKWLSAFLESYRPPLDGERYLKAARIRAMMAGRTSGGACLTISVMASRGVRREWYDTKILAWRQVRPEDLMK